MAATATQEFPVVIAGGGLIGLSTAMFLAQQGVASLAVERLRGGSPLPRAAHFHLRTLELFRLAGIEDEVKRRSEDDFLPEGAIIAMDSLSGRKLADIIGSLNAGVEVLSPCRRLFISQPSLEPILRRRARAAGAQVLEGYQVASAGQDATGVTVIVKDAESGQERELRAEYLVAADGAHSTVRELLGIPLDGRGVFSNSITIYFTADLSPQLGGKPLSVIYINNAVFGGFMRMNKDCQSGFIGINRAGDPLTDPDAANVAKDISEKRLIEFVRAAAGVPDLPVRIDGVARWRATSDVARRFARGRIFLAGDAAHLMPPNGGFGGNTGIHDAHNLAWKLAYVLKGLATPSLLDSYDLERRPVAKFTVEQAYTRYVTRTAPYLGATDFQPLADDFNIELGHVYHSPAILADGEDDDVVHADPHQTRGRPGTRAPHLWLARAERQMSTLDLFGGAFVLLAAPQGATWCRAAQAASKNFPRLAIDSHLIGSPDLRDPAEQFARAYGLSQDGAALVRPDGFVAWRSRELAGDPQRTLEGVFDTLLMRSRVPH
jgi:2-polyprenyl-6-methoxyphenol hydroxylase-like FAD-dependent oxidoreductase